MFAVSASDLKLAGDYVLQLLRRTETIRYSTHFFDGSDEQLRQLRGVFGFSLSGDDDFPPVLADLAIRELEKAGLVTTTTLPEAMADGDNDYLITITDTGKHFLIMRENTVKVIIHQACESGLCHRCLSVDRVLIVTTASGSVVAYCGDCLGAITAPQIDEASPWLFPPYPF